MCMAVLTHTHIDSHTHTGIYSSYMQTYTYKHTTHTIHTHTHYKQANKNTKANRTRHSAACGSQKGWGRGRLSTTSELSAQGFRANVSCTWTISQMLRDVHGDMCVQPSFPYHFCALHCHSTLEDCVVVLMVKWRMKPRVCSGCRRLKSPLRGRWEREEEAMVVWKE